MTTYIVTYDLNKEVKRPDILKEIKKGGNWAKLSESSYAISTNETAEQVYSRLKPYLDNNDNCYIITLSRPYTGWGPKEVNDWLESHLQYQRA
ncbi:hypothetical protein N2599_08415 [Rhizobium sullae]|uniref:Uncharacterized protein n=1 Tax=Rhizobium sullae TaxID=50338 RepID=A0ABY5XN00_RHISU|nr:hypothetical protein [Rhizobium sullae]UWU16005.1 hypothetical protein N2599_08415 [Rhizobium sullae]